MPRVALLRGNQQAAVKHMRIRHVSWSTRQTTSQEKDPARDQVHLLTSPAVQRARLWPVEAPW